MNLLLKILQSVVFDAAIFDAMTLPAFIRAEILDELFEATADAFEYPTPTLDHLSYDRCLRTYALYTRVLADKALQSGRDISALKTQLYQNAYPLGGKLRRLLGVGTMEEVMELGQILYRAIGVELHGDTQGDLVVKSCFFSQFYSGPVCDLISALDDGVFSGLSGGGRLAFSQRMTEGRECCKAKLQVREQGAGEFGS